MPQPPRDPGPEPSSPPPSRSHGKAPGPSAHLGSMVDGPRPLMGPQARKSQGVTRATHTCGEELNAPGRPTHPMAKGGSPLMTRSVLLPPSLTETAAAAPLSPWLPRAGGQALSHGVLAGTHRCGGSRLRPSQRPQLGLEPPLHRLGQLCPGVMGAALLALLITGLGTSAT